jgi:hypothetical protein
MPAFYRYNFAILGSQTTTNGGAPIDYRFEPSGIWRWSGTDTYFVVEEAQDTNTNFDGDGSNGNLNEQIASSLQIGANRAQTVEIGGTDRQVIWDYTFTVTDGIDVWRVGVIDVDLDNSDAIDPGSENGYFLVFPDGFPPADTDLTYVEITENDNRTSHEGLGATVVCFAAGTMIETRDGPRSVETLAPGDMILTRDMGHQPLRWISSTHAPAVGDLAPVVITTGTLGNTSDLTVSPQHGVLVEDWRAELLYGSSDVLVRAIDLLGHDGVYRKSGGQVSYYHLLFDAHQLVQAAGIWSESLYPGDMTRQAVNPAARAHIETLIPDLERYGPKAAPCLRRFEALCLQS